MDARAKTVRELLNTGDQYLIPFFQRYYSWRRKNWDRLWNDLEILLEEGGASQHFLGPLVCAPVNHAPGETPAYQLIDGQQRLTTLTLLLAALRHVADERGLNELAEEVVEDYLIHKRKKQLQRYKLVPRVGDREALIAIIDDRIEQEHREFSVYKAWRYFVKRISDSPIMGDEAGLRRLLNTITGQLALVAITIDRENPYEIFESLNSTGLPLEESDLIRNYLFMQVPIEEQDDFNDMHWAGFESMLEARDQFDPIAPTPFYRSYLMREGEYSNARATFVDFKERNRRRNLNPVDQVAELKRFLRYEQMLRRPSTVELKPLRELLEQLAQLEVTTAHPLMMALLDRAEAGQMSEEELLGCLSDLASFVLRRSICGDSTRTYGRWFVEAAGAIKDDPRQDLRKYYFRRGWPDDAAFLPRLESFELYKRERKKARMMLIALEQSYGHKEQVSPATLTIEHVMPQTISDSKSGRAWRAMLGENWKEVAETHLHTLGNLTLTGYNSDLSNRPFDQKKEELARSNLLLNDAIASHESWDAEVISERSRQLATELGNLWPCPEGGHYRGSQPLKSRKMTTAERHKAVASYWSGLATKLDERGVLPYLPTFGVKSFNGFKSGVRGFRLNLFLDARKRYVGVGLTCRGPHSKANFQKLIERREEIEKAIGDELLWNALPEKKYASRISLRKAGLDLHGRDNWQLLQDWQVEKIERFFEVFSAECGPLADPETDEPERHAYRLKFWEKLLEASAEKTDLFQGRKPTTGSSMWASAGRPGLGYRYETGRAYCCVALAIDLGKGLDEETRRTFEEFKQQRVAIESEFGETLLWNRKEGKRTCRIIWRSGAGGYRSDESQWPELHEAMIDTMLRFEALFGPRLRDLQEGDS